MSPYSNGSYAKRMGVERGDFTWIQRWEHRVCARGGTEAWLAEHGWQRRLVPGKFWRSGNQACRIEKMVL